ncbi:unnamed protein product [Clavelina lepadiformis]|uniref:Uncharacterized protein n=1 Tax=Clavelina lepadiformis TaxID=159417 RepID=A0ABP0G9W3_CLALP
MELAGIQQRNSLQMWSPGPWSLQFLVPRKALVAFAMRWALAGRFNRSQIYFAAQLLAANAACVAVDRRRPTIGYVRDR